MRCTEFDDRLQQVARDQAAAHAWEDATLSELLDAFRSRDLRPVHDGTRNVLHQRQHQRIGRSTLAPVWSWTSAPARVITAQSPSSR